MSNEPQQPEDSRRQAKPGEPIYPPPILNFGYEGEEEHKKERDEMHARIIEQLKTHKKGRTRSRWRPLD